MKRMIESRWKTAALVCTLCVVSAGARADSLTDVDAQGEYMGNIGVAGSAAALGAQVVAQGGGAFKVEFFPGGLPGDGATGIRSESAGQSDSNGVGIQGDAYHGRIQGDTLRGSDSIGETFLLLKHSRVSPTLGLAPPANATVLFDGTSIAEWKNAQQDSLGELQPLEREATTLRQFANFSLHVEFRLPFLPFSVGQARANSGLRFLTDRYLFAEIQILDSFGDLPGTENCGGIEGQYAPNVMADFPPLSWQTLDVQLTTPAPADTPATGTGRITVWQNGILIHPGRELPWMGSAVNIALQSLDSPGAFRNIWIVDGNDHYPFLPGAGLQDRVRARATGHVATGSGIPGDGARGAVRLRYQGRVFRPDGARLRAADGP